MDSDPDIIRQKSWTNHATLSENAGYAKPPTQDTSYKHTFNPYPTSPSGVSAKSNSSSSAPSSVSSIFSVDAPSVQSSASSASLPWSGSTWNQYSHNQVSSQNQIRALPSATTYQPQQAPVALEARQNPRRTQRLYSQDSQNGLTQTSSLRAPPALVRQSDRKNDFVDSLVDTTTQMVETIWPLSAHVQSRPTPNCSRQPSKMVLRYFIQEVLKRSKTSYSTLQVALYYLVLIQPHVPTVDFTQEQPNDSASSFSIQCGRRMFIAALILASKYLQDRNFSANAWGKISGLSTWDLNVNERAFVCAINWKLHIPEKLYSRWTDIVLQFSPSSPPDRAPRSLPRSRLTWKEIVVRLTPELDALDFGSAELSDDSGYDSPGSPELSASPPPLLNGDSLTPPADEPTPTQATAQWVEQTPTAYTEIGDTKLQTPKLPPSQPHPQLLPTPQLTPQVGPFCTPAVGASGACSRRSSMSQAMSHIRDTSIARCTLDRPEEWPLNRNIELKYRAPTGFPTLARRSSLATSASSVSSPDTQSSDVSTQYSDASSRPSRSSSISSVASSLCAPAQPPKLAVQATRRCANMQLCGPRTLTQICLSPSETSCSSQYQTPQSLKCSQDKSSSASWTATNTHGTVDSSKLPREIFPAIDNPLSRDPKCMKKINPARGFARLGFAHPSSSETQAAATLQSFAVGGPQKQLAQQGSQQTLHHNIQSSPEHMNLPQPTHVPHRANAGKRARPNSMSVSLEDIVSQEVAPRGLADVTNIDNANVNGNSNVVLEDDEVADSFLLRKENHHAVREANKKPTKPILADNKKPSKPLSGENAPRKKACAGSDRGGRECLRRGSGILLFR